MGRRTWPAPTDDEIKIARSGITIQAEARGLNTTDPMIRDFIDSQVDVKAELFAQIRFLQNIVDEGTIQRKGKS